MVALESELCSSQYSMPFLGHPFGNTFLDYFPRRGRTYENVEYQLFDGNEQGNSEVKAQADGKASPRLRA